MTHLTSIRITAYANWTLVTASVGFRSLFIQKVSKHLHSLSAFFVPVISLHELWPVAWEYLRVRRFLLCGTANPVQPATLSFAALDSRFFNLIQKEASHV